MPPVRGTRNLWGPQAREILNAIDTLREHVEYFGFQPFIPSALAYAELFDGQIGDNRAYEFRDRSDRRLVLTPEVTAIAREEFRNNWNSFPKPVRIWYATRCYRYDKPQRGRYREFWQFGVESFGDNYPEKAKNLLRECLNCLNLKNVEYRDSVKRGLGYYVEDGFEAWKKGLQIAGGGRYPEGVGFAIGIDRAVLIRSEDDNNDGDRDS